MIDRSALEFLQEHVQPFQNVESVGSESALIARPCTVAIESMEQYQPRPSQIKQGVQLASMISFCEYIKRFGDEDTSIFLNADQAFFKAMLDYHGSGEASWCRHTASFSPKRSLEWESWTQLHKQPINQITLAHFIEERVSDILAPSPGEVLQAALEFQAVENLVLGSSHNLDDGSVRFVFTKDNASKTVDFPHRIQIRIPVFENEEPEELAVRIRYKVDGDGALVFVVSLVKDPAMIVRNRLVAMAASIRKQCEGKYVYEGSL